MNGTETIAAAGPYPYTSPMTATLIGYARCSTDRQDPAAQRQALLELGVVEDRIYTRSRPHRHHPRPPRAIPWESCSSISSPPSPSPAPSPDQPSIAHSTDPIPLSVRSCPLPESTRTSRWRRRCGPAWSSSPASPHGPSPTSRRVAFGSQRAFFPTLVLTLCRICI